MKGAPFKYFFVTLLFFILLFCLHISVGAKSISFGVVLQALFSFDASVFEHIIIFDIRLPRAVFAILAGAALSVSGALMQGITRNPLADPGILGVLSGASFAVVVIIGFFDLASTAFIPLIAAGGAALTSVVVWLIASSAKGGATPMILVLSGSVVAAFFSALITMIHLMDEGSFKNLRVWLSGSLSNQNIDILYWTIPWFVGGFCIAFSIAKQITALAMGHDVAVGLGVNIKKIRVIVLLSVVLLSAAAVALAGPLGFVGLVIPHVVRLFVGGDYRWIIPFSAVMGSLYLLIIDILARILVAPFEISTGVMTALVGAPVFVWLVRTKLR